MQRTFSIFFISGNVGKQICSRLSLNSLSKAQVTAKKSAEYWFDVYKISTHSLIRDTKQMQAIKKRAVG